MQVKLSNQAGKFLDSLHEEKYKQKLEEMIGYLEINPVPYKEYDLKKIKGMESSYRLRKGDFRVEYAYDNVTKVVYITKISRRKKAYKK